MFLQVIYFLLHDKYCSIVQPVYHKLYPVIMFYSLYEIANIYQLYFVFYFFHVLIHTVLSLKTETLSSLVAPEVVITTTSGAASDDKVGIIKTLSSQCVACFFEALPTSLLCTKALCLANFNPIESFWFEVTV